MLAAHPGKTCLFVSGEIITMAFYPGELLGAVAVCRPQAR
jgi:hypothetical protein